MTAVATTVTAIATAVTAIATAVTAVATGFWMTIEMLTSFQHVSPFASSSTGSNSDSRYLKAPIPKTFTTKIAPASAPASAGTILRSYNPFCRGRIVFVFGLLLAALSCSPDCFTRIMVSSLLSGKTVWRVRKSRKTKKRSGLSLACLWPVSGG